MAFPLNVFLRTLETLLVEEVEDFVDRQSESESESVLDLHFVGSLIGRGDFDSVSELLAPSVCESLFGWILNSVSRIFRDSSCSCFRGKLFWLVGVSLVMFLEMDAIPTLDFALFSFFFSGEGFSFCGDSDETRLLDLGFNLPKTSKKLILIVRLHKREI